MHVELREQMIYHVPPELKDLWTRFQDMREQITKEQSVARAIKDKEDAIKAAKRKKRMEELSLEISLVVGILVVLIVMGLLFTWIHYDKKKRWPELDQKTYRRELEKEKRLRNEKILEAIQHIEEKNQAENKKLITNEEK